MTSVPEFKDVEVTRETDTPSGEFMAVKGFDVDSKLDELAKTADKLKDWSRVN